MNKQQFIETIQANRTLLEEFSVKSISVFGSVARGEDRLDSDIDILVEFDPDAGIVFSLLPVFSEGSRMFWRDRLILSHRMHFTRR